MTIDRPPRSSIVFSLFSAFFFLCLLNLHAQEIVLPDIVIHRKMVKNVPLQNESPEIGATWIPREPAFRRIYAFPIDPSPVPWVYSLESYADETHLLIDPNEPQRAGKIIKKINAGVNALTADNQ